LGAGRTIEGTEEP